ncbi:hypothetical protein [Oceanobacillus polygoni]|uniref:Uncharacterized protein n=1 Tax=Oceanobacillus polygoni TaxID=1235259 RepID=A0A9X1CF12_9BACI|nr:hypothetical protein [Oceanobacillus polygoni]MBP2076542.1 hypothetical protein [Oceanobacillus polygoni]
MSRDGALDIGDGALAIGDGALDIGVGALAKRKRKWNFFLTSFFSSFE